MSFDDIWNATDESEWNRLLRKYWSLVSVDNIQVEIELNRLTPDRIAHMDGDSWYAFLHDEYFVWKYTAKNRLATTRKALSRHRESGELEVLNGIRLAILNLVHSDIAASLKTACEIRGLGVAGASGLLSLLFPHHYSTVDQFVVKALSEVQQHADAVRGMNPDGLKVSDGVTLTTIMRAKAGENNARFNSVFWTPRTVEMALWAYRS
jgi:hypothetical protein